MGHNHPPKQSAEAPAQFELSADDINPQLAEVWGTADTAEQRLTEKYQDFSQQDLYQLAMDSYKTSHELKQKGVLSLRETVRQQEAQHVYEEAVSAAQMHLIGQIDTAEVVLKRYDLTDEQIADEVDKDLAKEGLTGLSAKQIMRRVNEKRAKYTEMREAVEREKEENERYLEQLNAVPDRALRELMREDDDEYQMTVKSDGTVQWGGRAASVDIDTPQAAAGQGPEAPEPTSRPEAPTDAEPTPDTSETTGETEGTPISSEKMAIGSAAVDRTINTLAAEAGLEAPTATTEAMAANAADIEQPTTAMEAGQGPEAPEAAAQPHAANEKAANAQTGDDKKGEDRPDLSRQMLGLFNHMIEPRVAQYDPNNPVTREQKPVNLDTIDKISDESRGSWIHDETPGWRGKAKRFIGRLSPRNIRTVYASMKPFVRESGRLFNTKNVEPDMPKADEIQAMQASLLKSPLLKEKLTKDQSGESILAIEQTINMLMNPGEFTKGFSDYSDEQRAHVRDQVADAARLLPLIKDIVTEDHRVMDRYDDYKTAREYNYIARYERTAKDRLNAQAVTKARTARRDAAIDRAYMRKQREMQYKELSRSLTDTLRGILNDLDRS